MSERYNVAASAVLGENYKITNIEASNYNPSIDGNITVTITVTDVFGDAISNESVTVTASEGNFTQLNGSDITAASSVTGTTNSSGQFTLTYTCSEWGLVTFSANNNSTQIKVQGFRTLSLTNGTLYYDNEKVMCEIAYHPTSTWTASTWTDIGTLATIPSELRPKQNAYTITGDTRLLLRVNNGTGKFQYNTNGNSISSPYFYCTFNWLLP